MELGGLEINYYRPSQPVVNEWGLGVVVPGYRTLNGHTFQATSNIPGRKRKEREREEGTGGGGGGEKKRKGGREQRR